MNRATQDRQKAAPTAVASGGPSGGLDRFRFFTEWPTRSKRLFLRNSGRKTATHSSWNCSKGSPVR
ncbi:MAG: hypothetical protein EOS36_28015 [Mesorhizobium sp.]|nr:MAG: hypothetical protein EOS36_28015 [Mesorhizobium sp.]RWE46832.1 MAG: hypothetical protein EOS79_11630 [Mesorhizobium sp.]